MLPVYHRKADAHNICLISLQKQKGTIMDNLQLGCGYIKLKYPIDSVGLLWECPVYHWMSELGRVRVTDHNIYLALGHDSIPDNETAKDIIMTALGKGVRITRVDFYVDYEGTFPFDAYYTLRAQNERGQATIVKSPTGKTVYVGKRSSARMLRVYDKRGEILHTKKVDIGYDVTRVELEVKRNAVDVYVDLFLRDKHDAILGDIQHRYGLSGFCKHSKPVRLDKVEPGESGALAFVTRYHDVIGRAYRAHKGEFLELIGESNNEKCNI